MNGTYDWIPCDNPISNHEIAVIVFADDPKRRRVVVEVVVVVVDIGSNQSIVDE
jgi:hypothetical protein